MSRPSRTRRSMVHAFLPYAAASLIPVLLLGVALALGYRAQARANGIARAQSQAHLLAQTAIEPILDGTPLGVALPSQEQMNLQRVVGQAVTAGSILRLRLRNLDGTVVYSDDGSGFSELPDDEALDAAHGQVIARLTRLGTDANDRGQPGVPAVEVYQPLTAGTPPQRVGVLELYLPYQPIEKDIAAGLRTTYHNLAIGLVALYLTLLVITASVTRRLRTEVARNAYQARHDALTGLPNRAAFQRSGEAAVARAVSRRLGVRREGTTAVAVIDLDRFKAINDTLGPRNGDVLLRRIAERLASHTRKGDTVARLGGDEFGLILRDTADPHDALCRIRGLIESELDVAGIPLAVEASIGYAVTPDDAATIEELLQYADVAVHHAKARHLGVVRYHPSQNHYDAASLSLISEFRRAVTDNQLVLHYQPKAKLSDGAVEAIEALVRWHHPARGLLYPDVFVPLVEQTDLIDDLTRWVLRHALEDLATIGDPHLAVAVNISARNLSRHTFAADVKAAVRRAGIEPHRLVLELTETALLFDPTRAHDVFTDLTSYGIRVSIDDFGRGQTSLGYLSALPLSEIKIDRTFVRDMVTNAAHAAIVRSVVELGHNLGLIVVAEGVETAEVGDELRECGCDVAQGYWFARPMPLVDLRRWLAGSDRGDFSLAQL